MGIHGLSKLIADKAPEAIKENEIKNYFGRKVAIDASMSLYQFMIAVTGRAGGGEGMMQGLTDESGETTSHLQGMFNRTIKMIQYGIKPIYVFDGKPPTFKGEELSRRAKKREEAEESMKEAVEAGDLEAQEKFSKRTVRVSKKQNEEAKRLLKLMGVPIIEAPCEAEAQCARMAAAGLVWATGSEDMDSLTLGTPIMLRHLTFSEARKMPIKEIHLDKVLDGLKFTMDQFIDLCILLGCDYCDTIRGVGPVRALELIKQYGSIDEILKHLDTTKYPVPENFNYEAVRGYFKEPEHLDTKTIELKWDQPDEEGIVEFLVKEKSFNEERVRNAIAKLKKSKSTSVQGRLTSFFGEPTVVKRKVEEKVDPKKKGKTGKNSSPASKSKSPMGKKR
eukprot:TRINITY_DN26745_c0_g1_i1.p1 TRINITY_DN26745_c0_g1~~TRINITY_DN26745_c0_g1_i1.p1  ORF type:complete len:392 (-),score=107.15 TRINITY_DN26745_c0_g1_i1:6-1181(-)